MATAETTPPQAPSRCRKESVGRRAVREAPGGGEEALVGVNGRLRVVGSGWMTRWGWDGVWLIAQRTTGWGNNGITIQRAHAGTHAHLEPQSGEALPPSTPGLCCLTAWVGTRASAYRFDKFPKGSGLGFLIC